MHFNHLQIINLNIVLNMILKDHTISLEILNFVVMTYLSSKHWENTLIKFYCDNSVVISALNSKLSYPKANLLKLLARQALKNEFILKLFILKGRKIHLQMHHHVKMKLIAI